MWVLVLKMELIVISFIVILIIICVFIYFDDKANKAFYTRQIEERERTMKYEVGKLIQKGKSCKLCKAGKLSLLPVAKGYNEIQGWLCNKCGSTFESPRN